MFWCNLSRRNIQKHSEAMIVASCKPKIGVWGDTKFSTDTFKRRYVVFIFCLIECCVPGKRERILWPTQFKQNSPHCEIYMKPEKTSYLRWYLNSESVKSFFPSRILSSNNILRLTPQPVVAMKKAKFKVCGQYSKFGPANQRLDSCELL